MAVDFVQLLIDYMALRGMNQRGLAREIGVSRSAVTRWMQGSIPSYATLVRIHDTTGIPMPALMEAGGYAAPANVRLPDDLPSWLVEVLAQLTPGERMVVGETGLSLLRARGAGVDEERSQ